ANATAATPAVSRATPRSAPAASRGDGIAERYEPARRALDGATAASAAVPAARLPLRRVRQARPFGVRPCSVGTVGRAMAYPCAYVAPCSCTHASSSPVSTPSAMLAIPSSPAISRILRVMSALYVSVVTP